MSNAAKDPQPACRVGTRSRRHRIGALSGAVREVRRSDRARFPEGLSERCVYCGARDWTAAGIAVRRRYGVRVCPSHSDLPGRDPHYVLTPNKGTAA